MEERLVKVTFEFQSFDSVAARLKKLGRKVYRARWTGQYEITIWYHK